MPLYKITGASKSTGADRVVQVEAANEKTAVNLANEKHGIFVQSSEMVTSAGTPARAAGPTPASGIKPRRKRPPSYLGSSIIAAALITLGLISFAVGGLIFLRMAELSALAGLSAGAPFFGGGVSLCGLGCALSLLREIAQHTHPASRAA